MKFSTIVLLIGKNFWNTLHVSKWSYFVEKKKLLVILNMFYQYNYTFVQNHCYDSILKLSS